MDATFSVNYTHRLRVTSDALAPGNDSLLNVMPPAVPGKPAKVQFFIDAAVAASDPTLLDRVKTYVASHQGRLTMPRPVQLVPGGEDAKNAPRWLEDMLRHIHDATICRQSYVVVIGGGAVLDCVGFAAAIAHRGVRLVRLPTTTLAQSDSGVGVKNGINGFGKKNYMGSFAPPWAVINDDAFLRTLSPRDWRCGFVEAVKVACIKDRAFFDRIETGVDAINARDHRIAVPIITDSALWHLRHITGNGDPFEMTTARPLDFGHWAAHKLEQMTWFRLRHGEAVAIGIAIDVTYAAMMGLLDEGAAVRIKETLAALGFDLYDDAMQQVPELLKGLEEFREHLGGRLTVTMLRAIGAPVDVHEIDANVMGEAIRSLAPQPTRA
jgi:3-dehydroquinate synthase